MEFLFILLAFIIMLMFIRNMGKISKNSTSRVKLEEIVKLFNFLEFKYNSLNSVTIYDSDYTKLNIEIIDKQINIQIISFDFIKYKPIEVNLTLPFDIPMNRLLDRINLKMDEFMDGYREISPNKQITFIDYLRHMTEYENISDYANETLYALEEIIETIEEANLNDLDITEDCKLAVENYQILCDNIINIKANLMEIVSIDVGYKPLIEVLEDIYKKANYIAKQRENVARLLQQINEDSLSIRYQEII